MILFIEVGAKVKNLLEHPVAKVQARFILVI